MKQWNNSPYTLTISEESDPLYTLYYGSDVVMCTTSRGSENPYDVCKRVVNNYLRYKCYNHWLNIMSLSGYDLDPHLEETWLEFMKSKFVVKLKILLADIQEDLAS
jgi:hypothetical protein